jgi:hypothetical protein
MERARGDGLRDYEAAEKSERSRERRRAFLAWTVFAVASVGLHHLALQGLDASDLGIPGRKPAKPPVMLDLFQPPPEVARAIPPPAPQPPRPAEAVKPPAPPTPTPPVAETPKPGQETTAEQPRNQRPRHPRPPALPAATPDDEQNPDQLTLRSDVGDPYDPLNPQLSLGDWGSERFAAADRFFDATDAERVRGLGPDALRSPLEQIGPWNDWGGDAAIAAANDFFGQANDGIQLAINPDRPDVLRYVPVDASVLFYLNLRAVAGGPHAEGVAALLRTIPDYQTMFGHIESELLARADELYITSSSPTDRSKTVVLIRHRMSEEEVSSLVGRQIALAGGKADWTTLSDASAVTVDRDHLDLTPWLYLFPEPGVILVVHRTNVGPVVAALEGRNGQGSQPQLVYQIRRLVGEEEDAAAPPAEAESSAPPTLFAVADAGSLGPHLRFVTRTLAGEDIGDLGAGYLRITGGEHPEVLGGLQLAAPEQVPRWQDLMRRIEDAELAQTFGFTWAGRDDRVFFRFGLTDPVVSSGLGLFRAWADRYYTSGVGPVLPDAEVVANVVTTGVASDGDAGAADVPRGPDGELLKDPSADAAGPSKTDGGTTSGGDAGTAPSAAPPAPSAAASSPDAG